MSPTNLQVISAETILYEDDVDIVVCPGVEGELGVLPQHAPIFTLLQPGEIRIKKGEQQESIFVTGGFLQITQEKVVVLADAGEQAQDIDEDRATRAKGRAEERLNQKDPDTDVPRAENALRRSVTRLRVAERNKR